MREIRATVQYRRDTRKLIASGAGQTLLDELEKVVDALASDVMLPKTKKDHPLRGNLKRYRECHVKDDWLLIYEKRENVLYLHRTGTHEEIF